MAIALAGNQPLKTSSAAYAATKLLRRLRVGPLFRWRFSGFRPQRILAEPVDLHLADPDMAHEFYHGRFALAGRIVQAGSISPFAIEPPTPAWEAALHDFSWLRHMDAARTPLANAHARSLMNDWIDQSGKRMKGPAWQADVVARRLVAWLCHARMLLDGAGDSFEKRFLRSLGFQFRFLRIAIHNMDENEHRLQAAAALCFASVALPVSPAMKRAAQLQLVRSLTRQILPDGGHISRNPAVLLSLLTELLALRHLYAHSSETAPRLLVDSVERMLPALRFFVHQDQTLAHFNGVGPVLPERLGVVLGLDETAGHPFSHAPHSGYQRLHANQTTVIADTGTVPPRAVSYKAAAGCLSFEMSSGADRFIINAGMDPFGPSDYRQLARATAAHSTATLNDTSSCKFQKNSSHKDAALVSGPTAVKIERVEGAERIGFVASHNGYVTPFNLMHERGLVLSADGNVIDGFDRFFANANTAVKSDGRDHVAVRFHLHPHVEVSHDGNSLRLEVMGGDAWSFMSPDADIQLEDSIDFADLNGPKRTRQIVLNFRPALTEKVRWRFTRITRAV
ncbi:heparinase II/III family protein [Bartonella sp. LJL80]